MFNETNVCHICVIHDHLAYAHPGLQSHLDA